MNILLFYISAVCSLGAFVVIFIFTFTSFHFVTPPVTKLGGRWKGGGGGGRILESLIHMSVGQDCVRTISSEHLNLL